MSKNHATALAAGLLSTGLLSLAATPAAAQLSDLHAKVRVGNKLCFSDHYHSGSSAGHKSRKEAERAAIASWQGFTSWEYGSAWGRFSLAAGKRISCSNSGGWGCQLEARPCRYYRPVRRR